MHERLRSVLRQDPDIVLVGEIRDIETAGIAVQAGFSGHFVLSTLHTNDAASAVVRLRDMGVDAFKVAAVLKGVVAQRLVRKLCDQCAEIVPVESLPAEARPPAGRQVRIRRSTGCRNCNGRGFRGREAILEIMPVDESVARLIDAGALPDVLAAAARKIGMRSLWESGLERVWSGSTSLDELKRVLGERAGENMRRPPQRRPRRRSRTAWRPLPSRRRPPCLSKQPLRLKAIACSSPMTIPRCAG